MNSFDYLVYSNGTGIQFAAMNFHMNFRNIEELKSFKLFSVCDMEGKKLLEKCGSNFYYLQNPQNNT